jgi:Leucine-rich repeat (LRR) protein
MLSVLNLFDNKITQVHGLQELINLKRLNLQSNEIVVFSINLPNLEYLNLRENRIKNVSGLDSLTSLETLLLDRQKVNQELFFDEECLACLVLLK